MHRLVLVVVMSLVSACATARPLVIAHRGASGYLPEHSLPAVTAAHMMDIDYIEQDVVLTKDAIAIVLHDIHLESTTNVEQVFPARKRSDGRYYALDFDLSEIKQLSLHERTDRQGEAVFAERFPLKPTSFEVPTLQEEIDLIKGMNSSRNKQVGFYIEIKSPKFHRQAGYKIEEVVLKVLRDNSLEGKDSKVFLQCFDAETSKLLSTMTDLPIVQLVGVNAWKESDTDYEQMMTEEGLAEVATYARGIGPYLGLLLDESGNPKNLKLIEYAKELGLEIHAYTFRSDQYPTQMGSFEDFVTLFHQQIGITGFFADQPDLVKSYVQPKN